MARIAVRMGDAAPVSGVLAGVGSLAPLQVSMPDAPVWELGIAAVAIGGLFAALMKAVGAHLSSETKRGDDWRDQAKASTVETAKTHDILRSLTDAAERQRVAFAEQVQEVKVLRVSVADQAAEIKTMRNTAEESVRRLQASEASLARIEAAVVRLGGGA
ncbi:MAG: hypothetical protein M3Q74_13200 [Pseudomonadota bacterium]|nr:hypothetical protein [Pseudomonadota bacterium]